MRSVKEYYDKTATGWSNEFYNERKNAEVTNKFLDCFQSAGTIKPKILELGCGYGYDSKVLQELGAKVVGVDLSEKSIEIAKQNADNCKFFVGDFTKSLKNLGKFDGVYCLASIIHVPIEQMKTTFENIAGCLNVGGLLLISSYDGTGKNIKKSLANIKGEVFDKNINNYDAEALCSFAYPSLKLVDMWKFDDFDEGFRYYIFQKQE